jgi:hypothetical protein
MPSTTFMVFFDQTAVLEQDHGATTCRFVIPKAIRKTYLDITIALRPLFSLS